MLGLFILDTEEINAWVEIKVWKFIAKKKIISKNIIYCGQDKWVSVWLKVASRGLQGLTVQVIEKALETVSSLLRPSLSLCL